MKLKKTALSTAVLLTLGLGGMAVGPVASAAVLQANTTYRATINPTPYTTAAKFTASGSPTPNALIVSGTDGAWNSTFSFSRLPGRLSQGMTNNSVDISCGSASGTCGSSNGAAGTGAGSWHMTVSADGNSFTTSNFQADAIFATAGGTFVEYGHLSGGTLNATGSGSMTLNPTGRLGSVGNMSTTLYNEPWNIPDANGVTGDLGTTYAPLITGSSTNPDGTVTGSPITSNGDGTYNVILVSASQVGVDWGTFDSNPYVETWNVHLAPVPIPAAAWLFGSGLIGLVGIARRKKSS